MDLEALREELHRSIDAALDAYLGVRDGPGNGQALDLEQKDQVESWTHRWPNGYLEHYDTTTSYRVTGDFGEAEVLVAHCIREAWGRDRERIVVFGKPSGTSAAPYPWTEFVQTDDGDYAAKLSDPNDPRKSLRDGDHLPPRLASANVQRNDQIFRSIRDGAALRLVVAPDDTEAMIGHAYWMASLRGRI
ncbi:MAG TPA: hypothetical protein VIV12_17110 [Streptosporangiaceae bacterium]